MFKHPKKVWSGDAEDEYGWPPHRLPAATHLTAMHTLAPSKCCAAKAVFGLMWMGHGDSPPLHRVQRLQSTVRPGLLGRNARSGRALERFCDTRNLT